MSKRDVMFIRPSDCRYCWNGYFGLGHVVDYAADKSFNIEDLKSEQADNPYIDDTVNSFNPFMIYGFGHGNVNVYTANSETPVWVVGENLTHLSGRIIYLLSCLTANQLGPYFIDQGALSYGGFLISWTWMSNDTGGDPYVDEYAECFYRSVNKFFETLLDGNTMAQAMQSSIDEYNYWIDWWENSGHSSASNVIKWLIHDRDGLIIYGDPNASSVDCDEFTEKQDCLDAGCWWYDGACHCEHPPNIVSTHEFIVKAEPAKADIERFDQYYPIGYDVDEDGFSIVEYDMRIGNVGAGVSTIFIKLINEDIPETIWSRTSNIKPKRNEKFTCRIASTNTHETHHLIAGHIENGLEVIDDEITLEYNVEECNRLGEKVWPPKYERISQQESTKNIFGVKLVPSNNCEIYGIEYLSEETLYLPNPEMNASIYKVSDGSLVAKVTKPFEVSGYTALRRIYFNNPIVLEGKEEYWFCISRNKKHYGYQILRRTEGAQGIGTRMSYNPENELPDIFVPETTENECYIFGLYKDVQL